MRFSIYILSFLFLAACNNPSAPAKKNPVIENTPDAVAQYWLENYFANNFDLAKPYSTLATQGMMDTIQHILFTEKEHLVFSITALQCTSTSDKSVCTYVYVEGDEKIPESVQLKRVDNKWLVDAQLMQDEDLLENLDMNEDDFQEELDKIMQ